jgi:hypothetical protein
MLTRPHGLPAAGSFPNTCLGKADADTEAPQTSRGSLSLAAAHWVNLSYFGMAFPKCNARPIESNWKSIN